MIKFSRLADYAVVVLAILAKNDKELMAASSLSCQSGLPEPTVAKVLKKLSKNGVVISIRGASGGYKLAYSKEEITVAQIVTAVDGPVALTACVEESKDECCYTGCCPVKGRWDRVNVAVKNALSDITLADMMASQKSEEYDFINIKKNKEGACA